MTTDTTVRRAYEIARERYASLGVDTELAMDQLSEVSLSLHCWQGDDVIGFEKGGQKLGGGLAVTGNYLGRARTPDELRADYDKALSLIPGTHRVNLHACYLECDGQSVDRDEVEPRHFQGWIDWAKQRSLGMDFNPTFFSHPRAADGFTLAHFDAQVRQFWIEHGVACRRIGAAIGEALGTACITNVWIPDGFKDTPVDRKGPRERLLASLDAIFADAIDPRFNRDAVESKLFGIGSESYVAGSHEFYFGYAVSRQKTLCLDSGHFHPTEGVADKISSVLFYLPDLLLHVSRGVRWDSDHVVTLTDELTAIMHEIVRGDFLSRIHIGLDYFDASINRVAAWVIGARCTLKALLMALTEPLKRLRQVEYDQDYTQRLAMLEELKTMPFGSVWDQYCLRHDVPVGLSWLEEIQKYEREVLVDRS